MAEIDKTSFHSQLEDAYRSYYGADRDPLKFVPTVRDTDVAHEVAIGVDRAMSRIKDEDIVTDALRAQARRQGFESLEAAKRDILNSKLRYVVVNSEITHARLAPGDFNEDSEQAGAYEMGVGKILPMPIDPEVS